MTCNVRECVLTSYDLKTRLMCPSGQAHGFMQRAVAIHKTGSSDFWDGLASVVPGACVPMIASKARRPA